MTDIVYARAMRQIKAAEGLRLRVYDDATGKPITKGSQVIGVPTIGYGRALDMRNGLTSEECGMLLTRDITEKHGGLVTTYPWFGSLDEVRQVAVTDMAFTLGVEGLAKLKRFVIAMEGGAYDAAASRLLPTKWAADVKDVRADRIMRMIRSGTWPEDLP